GVGAKVEQENSAEFSVYVIQISFLMVVQVRAINDQCISFNRCHVANKTCPKNHVWNNQICRCLAQHDFGFSSHLGDSGE
ncbi:hypothetical protein ASZ78_006660, partial [Callipepla squamata]